MGYTGENYQDYELAELLEQELVGKRITKITDEKIDPDNGTVLLIEPK